MMLTKYKSPEELEYSVRDYKKVALFSCNVCANMNGVGGRAGLKFIKRRLEKWGKEVVVAQTITGCCIEAAMRQAVRIYLKPVRSKIDALVQISCMAGIKDAFYCNPGLPVIAACDPIGVETLLPHGAYYDDPWDNLVAYGLCIPCERCVLSFTSGICPYVECPSKTLYGPCDMSPKDGDECARGRSGGCVWKIIEKRGVDHTALQELKRLHEDGSLQRISLVERAPSPVLLRKIGGVFMARMPGTLVDVVHWIR